jgi:hypothetical protein
MTVSNPNPDPEHLPKDQQPPKRKPGDPETPEPTQPPAPPLNSVPGHENA